MNGYTKQDLINDASFRRWARGNATIEEIAHWDKWVQQREANRQKAVWAQAEITGYNFTGPPDNQKAKEWRRLQEELERSPGAAIHDISEAKNRLPTLNWFLKVAAIVLIGLGIGWGVYWSDSYTNLTEDAASQIVTVKTAFGEKKTISLSDGSQMIVNANSAISYTTGKSTKKEMVVDLQGEAYFDIAPRPASSDKVFRVCTKDGNVSVLGTKFSVSTREENTAVALKEGLVSIHPLQQASSADGSQTQLHPGELGRFYTSKPTVKIEKVNVDVYTSWANGKLIFDKTPLTVVAQRIEQTFGVEVAFRNASLHKRTISGAIENSSLDIITEGLSQTLMVPVKKENNIVYIGTAD
jgi:ferric-dicitrate binding protein FerR (iron transport regulator)